MPRKLRVENCGYHHVYNRGVAKSDIYKDEFDKVKFIEILSQVSREYKFNIHSFCLMDNHYHILVENKKENLSDGMRQINSQYASYFNKRHNRVGHLWQDRYKSWFVLDENYLFTLFRYIELNPVKAKMTKTIGEYKYCATYSILKDAIPPFLQNSFVLRDYHTHELFDILNIPLNNDELENIDRVHKR
jgi:REP element-mobilizing transposase RayT